KAEADMAILQDLIRSIRDLRADSKVEPKIKTPVRVHAGAAVCELIRANSGMVERLASADSIEFVQESLAQQTSVRAAPQFEVAIVYEQKIDTAAERERLTKELKKLEGQLANAERQLGNGQFLSKAPGHVVDGLRKQEAELKILLAKVRGALDKLG